MTYQEIAEKLKVSIDDVKATMRKHGLTESMIVEQADLDSLAQKMGIAVNAPISKMAVSRTPAPTAGLAVKPQSGVARKQRKAQVPDTAPKLQEVLNLKPRSLSVEGASIATATTQADAAEGQLVAAQMLADRVDLATKNAQTLNRAIQAGDLFEANLWLSVYGLEPSTDINEAHQRLNEYFEAETARNNQLAAEAQGLLDHVNQMFSMVPGMEGVRL